MKILAHRIYPEPDGTDYFEIDFSSSSGLIEIFDYCQILEAVILKEGWRYLFTGLKVDEVVTCCRKSGWLEDESDDEVIENLISMALDCGYDPRS